MPCTALVRMWERAEVQLNNTIKVNTCATICRICWVWVNSPGRENTRQGKRHGRAKKSRETQAGKPGKEPGKKKPRGPGPGWQAGPDVLH